MTIKLAPSKAFAVIRIVTNVSVFFIPGMFDDMRALIFFLILVVNVTDIALEFARTRVEFKETHFRVVFGLASKRLKYDSLDRVAQTRQRVMLWPRGKKAAWGLRMKEEDKAAFMTEFRKHNPSIVEK